MQDYTEVFDSYEDEQILPDAYRIRVTDITKMDETVKAVRQLDDVDSVSSPDSFVELLTETRRIITIVASAIIIALLFLVGSILEGTFGLMTIIGAAIGGFIIALVPTAVFGLIGKAIRKECL